MPSSGVVLWVHRINFNVLLGRSSTEAEHVPSFDRGLAALRSPVRLLSGEQFVQWQGSFTQCIPTFKQNA